MQTSASRRVACSVWNTKVERILYSVDWPFSKNEEGLEFVEGLKKSEMVTKYPLEQIAYENAEKQLGVKTSN